MTCLTTVNKNPLLLSFLSVLSYLLYPIFFKQYAMAGIEKVNIFFIYSHSFKSNKVFILLTFRTLTDLSLNDLDDSVYLSLFSFIRQPEAVC